MPTRPFRVLYRQFLFRVVEPELLSPHGSGDAHQVFTQIAAILVLFSILISLPALDRDSAFSAPTLLFFEYRFEHFLITTTMLVVGLFAILSWRAMFPEHDDMLVLAPLPVRASTIVLSKLAAIVTALSLTVFAMHAAAGLVWPLILNAPKQVVVMPSFARTAALAPVNVSELKIVLDGDLATARASGWLSPASGGGLSIGISQHGVRQIWTYGAARPDSLFQIGSVTKTFTAAALSRMVQDGAVALETPVRELMPSVGSRRPLRQGQREITLLDLATHRSGLPVMPPGIRPDRRRSPFAKFDATDLERYLQSRGSRRPGEVAFLYSNLGFGLLGEALATKAQSDYASLVRRLITEPLGLRDTGIDLTQEQLARVLQGYDDEGQAVGTWAFAVLAGAGAMYSTAPDLLTWLEANLHPTGPLAVALETAHQPQRPAPGNERIGLAWMIDNTTGAVSHTGAVGGYTADTSFSPKDDLAVVVLANRGPGAGAPAVRVADAIRARLAGKSFPSLDDGRVPARGGIRGWLRLLLAYWITMLAASAFTAGLLMGVQGLAMAFLPRRRFLRVSPLLQLLAFAVIVCGYLLLPIGFGAADLMVAENGGPFAASPSYWFLGLLQSLTGARTFPGLASRAWIGLAVAVTLASVAYGVSYLRMLRGITEEPDVAGATRVGRGLSVRSGPLAGLAGFSLKTLSRSPQPRAVLAFHWGLGVAFGIAFLKTPTARQLASTVETGAWHESSVQWLVASILLMGSSVMAARSAFAIPRDIPANWIFKMVPLRDPRGYAVSRRGAMLVASVVPVSIASAVVFPLMWPWLPAMQHVIVLTLFGLALVELVESGNRKIPFACTYLPGRSRVHIKIVVLILVIVPLVVVAATFEREALLDGTRYPAILAVLGVVWAAARVRTMLSARPPDRMPVFDEEPADRVVTLGLWDHRLRKSST